MANWDDWGHSNSICVDLTEGQHLLRITFDPEDENMNLSTNHALIDAIILRRY